MEFVNHTALSLELKLNALRLGGFVSPGGTVKGGAAVLVIGLHAVSE